MGIDVYFDHTSIEEASIMIFKRNTLPCTFKDDKKNSNLYS